jgi:plastocyanin
MRYRRLVLTVALAGLIAGACGGGGGDNGGDGGGGGTATDTITMVDNEFRPSDPAVPAGSDLTLKNDGSALHSFTIEDEGIDEQVQPGAEATLTISVAAGTYAFACSFHPEMTGTLTVQ